MSSSTIVSTSRGRELIVPGGRRTVVLTDREAPQRILETVRFESFYHAVLKKRFVHIAADDFVKFARRFVFLCEQVYQGNALWLRRDESVPLGWASVAASLGQYEKDPGEVIRLEDLGEDRFREIFATASTITLTIKPTVHRPDVKHSFAKMAWTRGRPKTVFFYAQQGGRHDIESACDRPLEGLLYRKMFHVPDSAPNLRFSVRLGIDASLSERRGNLKFPARMGDCVVE